MAFLLKKIDLHPKPANWYCEYLASDKWKFFKSELIIKRGPYCEWCFERLGDKIPQEVLHHKTYARLFKEFELDVVLLCKECHSYTHQYHDIPCLPWIYKVEPPNKTLLNQCRNYPIVLTPRNRK